MSSLEVLFQTIAQGNSDEFLVQFPHPFLINESEEINEESDSFATVTTNRTLSLTPASSRGLRLDAKFVPVQKKKRGKFSNMISVGRTLSNDLTFNHTSISKFHAYFIQKSEGAWFIQDANSSNGTFVNGQRIAVEAPTAITDGMSVQFSPDTRFRFFTARGLYKYLYDSMVSGS
jgi:hypothetical protein